MKVAVLSDTHAPRYWKACPPAVARRLEELALDAQRGQLVHVEEAPVIDVAGSEPPVAELVVLAFEQMVQRGDGVVSGEHMLRFWNIPFSQHEVEAALQRDVGDESDEARVLLDRFERWDRATLDLPGAYYLEVTERVFRQNQIARGRFVALGR